MDANNTVFEEQLQSPMSINAFVPRQDQDNITTMQAELKEHIVSPITVTACIPGRRDGINMLQDNLFIILTSYTTLIL